MDADRGSGGACWGRKEECVLKREDMEAKLDIADRLSTGGWMSAEEAAQERITQRLDFDTPAAKGGRVMNEAEFEQYWLQQLFVATGRPFVAVSNWIWIACRWIGTAILYAAATVEALVEGIFSFIVGLLGIAFLVALCLGALALLVVFVKFVWEVSP